MGITATLITASFAIRVATFACPFCKPQTTGLFVGESVLMGNGTLRSWVDVGADKKPRELGITFTDLAMEGLPFVKYTV